MKTTVAVLLVTAYVAAVVIGVPAVGPWFAQGLVCITSMLFVFSYLMLVRGRAVLPILLVVALTIFFPLTVLAWIGLSAHATWHASIRAVLVFLQEQGPPWGLQFVLPTAGAIATALITARKLRPPQKPVTRHAL